MWALQATDYMSHVLRQANIGVKHSRDEVHHQVDTAHPGNILAD